MDYCVIQACDLEGLEYRVNQYLDSTGEWKPVGPPSGQLFPGTTKELPWVVFFQALIKED